MEGYVGDCGKSGTPVCGQIHSVGGASFGLQDSGYASLVGFPSRVKTRATFAWPGSTLRFLTVFLRVTGLRRTGPRTNLATHRLGGYVPCRLSPCGFLCDPCGPAVLKRVILQVPQGTTGFNRFSFDSAGDFNPRRSLHLDRTNPATAVLAIRGLNS